MQKNAPIGVLDSGVGGLSVLKCLQAGPPHEHADLKMSAGAAAAGGFYLCGRYGAYAVRTPQ